MSIETERNKGGNPLNHEERIINELSTVKEGTIPWKLSLPVFTEIREKFLNSPALAFISAISSSNGLFISSLKEPREDGSLSDDLTYDSMQAIEALINSKVDRDGGFDPQYSDSIRFFSDEIGNIIVRHASVNVLPENIPVVDFNNYSAMLSNSRAFADIVFQTGFGIDQQSAEYIVEDIKKLIPNDRQEAEDGIEEIIANNLDSILEKIPFS